MKVKFSTLYLTKFLDVGSYGAEYAEWCEESISEIVPDVESYTQDLMNEMFEDVFDRVLYHDTEDENRFKLSNFKFNSPREYNFYNDCVDFVIEFDDCIKDLILGFIEKEKYFEDSEYGNFYEFIEENYKSSSGYINLCPENRDEFMESLYSKNNTEMCRALSQFITWIVGIDNDEYQETFDEYMRNTDLYIKYIDSMCE